MDRLKAFYMRAGVKKQKIKTILFWEGLYLFIFVVYKVYVGGFGKTDTAIYNISLFIHVAGMCTFIYSGNKDGRPGMELANMLEFYPVNIKKLYYLFISDALKFSVVHLLVSILIVSEMNVGYVSYIVAALIDIAVFLYFAFCYNIGFNYGDETSLDSANGVCILLCPILIVSVIIIYSVVL